MPKVRAESSAPDSLDASEEALQIPRQSWRDLLPMIPRRSLYKAMAMVLLLVAIVFLQRRTEVVVRHLGGITPASDTSAAPRLKLSPPVSPSAPSSTSPGNTK